MLLKIYGTVRQPLDDSFFIDYMYRRNLDYKNTKLYNMKNFPNQKDSTLEFPFRPLPNFDTIDLKNIHNGFKNTNKLEFPLKMPENLDKPEYPLKLPFIEDVNQNHNKNDNIVVTTVRLKLI